MSSALEGEDLENVQLVRMEDVQPSRDGRIDVLESCIIDHIEYDNECIIGDDQCGGTIHPIQIEAEDSNPEYVVHVPNETPTGIETLETNINGLDRWPTLEILPGGVIKPADKSECIWKPRTRGNQEMIYACAKCPETFKLLYCLVKHVKKHEEEMKSNKTKIVDLFLPKTIQKKDRQTSTPNSAITKVAICRKIITKRKKVNHRTKRLKI